MAGYFSSVVETRLHIYRLLQFVEYRPVLVSGDLMLSGDSKPMLRRSSYSPPMECHEAHGLLVFLQTVKKLLGHRFSSLSGTEFVDRLKLSAKALSDSSPIQLQRWFHSNIFIITDY